MARREGLTFLGSLPVDTELVTLLDSSSSPDAKEGLEGGSAEDGSPFKLLRSYRTTPSSKLFADILVKALNSLETIAQATANEASNEQAAS